MRDLGNKRYLIELDYERSFNYVINGGPWKYRGEAFLVVPYDGVSQVSEVPITTILLWVRIFNLSEFMMNEDYARSLGGRLGPILEYGCAVCNFLRVRVDFPLQKALKANLKVRIEGKVSAVPIKYENVPNYCFVCAVLGHDDNSCEEVELAAKGVRFGTELRASPLKRRSNANFSIPATKQAVARNLNFGGDKQEQVKSAASSSKPSGIKAWSVKTVGLGRAENYGMMADRVNDEEENEGPQVQIPREVSAALETGVLGIQMGEGGSGATKLLVQERPPAAQTPKEIVPHSADGAKGDLSGAVESEDSRLYHVSFSGNYRLSGSSTSVGHDRPIQSMLERTGVLGRRNGKPSNQVERKLALQVAHSGRSIEKSKKPKQPPKCLALSSSNSRGQQGMEVDMSLAIVKSKPVEMLEQSPAKKLKASTATTDSQPLTGAHGDPRQAQ